MTSNCRMVLETARMRLRPLTIHDAVKDYDAVMTNSERLRTVFRPGGQWPLGLTLEQDIVELGWHQTEFQLRTSFAYTVTSLDETQIMGCLYLPGAQAGLRRAGHTLGAPVACRGGIGRTPLRHGGGLVAGALAVYPRGLSRPTDFLSSSGEAL
ncbi:MAG: hypothetical protein R3E50_02480 [Halioglobus sp.]